MCFTGGIFSYQLFQYLKPPTIHLIAPLSTTFKRESTVTIIGQTEKEAVITVMGERVYQNKDGIFQYTISIGSKAESSIN